MKAIVATAGRIGALALAALLFATPQHAGGGSTFTYIVAKEGSIEFYKNGKVKKITGPGICSASEVQIDNFVKEFAGLGVRTVSPLIAVKIAAPDLCYYTNPDGTKVVVYGVTVDLTRNRRLDKMMAAIAGDPANTIFYAFQSPDLGPLDPNNPPPSPFPFYANFEWTAANAPNLSFFADDPWLVISNNSPTTGGTVFPAAAQLDVVP